MQDELNLWYKYAFISDFIMKLAFIFYKFTFWR